MLTRMTDEDWAVALEVFRACRSRRGDKGRDDRKFLEAMHYFTVHNITWRALPAEFGSWNSVWKRFWRLRQAGVFELFFETLASLSRTAHLVQMFDSTVVRFKRVALRCEKTERSFAAIVALAFSFILIKSVHTA
ncbi:transposase [Xanthobacter autotrophicus]|uniref:transposase n=1 Tax=Xanthobacter autotrophicus TaxID=280 RepID=UPI003727CDF1